jgi:DNA mismatch endonuclease (patch repair protein)
MDTFSKATRSRIMSSVRQHNTGPELVTRRALHRAGLRFRVNVRKLPGAPDLVFHSRRVALFVHGCFWHQHTCKRVKAPKTRSGYWQEKFDRNATRHDRVVEQLSALGWKSLVIWECETASSDYLAQLASHILQHPVCASRKRLHDPYVTVEAVRSELGQPTP